MKANLTPCRSVFNKMQFYFILFFIIAACQVMPAIAESDSLPADNFDDNSLGELWTLAAEAPTQVWLEETNGRLEARSTSTSDSFAACVSKNWEFSTDHDFAMQIDWHYASTATETGLFFGVNIPSELDDTYVDLNVDVDDDTGAPQVLCEASTAGTIFDEYDGISRNFNDGTFYVSYNSISDTLYLSVNGHWRAKNAENGDWVFQGILKGTWNQDTVSVDIGCWDENEEGQALGSGDAYFDNFLVIQGTLAGAGSDLNEGLVAYYPFCGNANDESGNGNHGIVNGPTLTQDRLGSINRAYNFDGNADTIDLPNSILNGLTNISTSIWVSTLKNDTAFLNGAPLGGEDEYNIGYDYGLKVRIKEQKFNTGIKINDNLWHHIVVLRDGSSGMVQIYLDGEFVGSHILPAGELSIGQGGLILGRDQDCLGGCFEISQDFSGKMDDIRIYNRLLSEQEVLEIFNAKTVCQSINDDYTLADNSVFYGTFTLDENEVFVIGNDESQKCNDDDDEYEYLYIPLEGSTATYQCEDNTVELTITDYTITIAEDDVDSTDDWSVIFSTDYNSFTYSGTTVDAGGIDNFSGTGVRVIDNGDDDLNEGLVAYWPFNGNANDESGNDNHGTVHGATLTEDRCGNLNSAYSLDGVDDYIDIPYKPEIEPSVFSISFWFFGYPFDGIRQFILSSDPNGYLCDHGYNLHRSSNSNLTFSIDIDGCVNNGTSISSSGLDLNNAWHHVTVIYDGYSRMFIDGGLAAQSASAINYDKTHASLRIGMLRESIGDSGKNFHGMIDDIRMYNRALSEQEISDLYGEECESNELNISTPSSFEAPAGSRVSIPVSLTNPESVEIEGIDITLTFDEPIIDAQGAELTGGVLENENYSLQTNINEIGEISLAISANSDLFSGEGILCYVQFDAVGNPEDISHLTFTRARINEEDIDFRNGSATITDPSYDVSGNVLYHANNTPVPSAGLDLIGGTSYHSQTNVSGNFTFSDVLAGNYSLKPSKTNDLGGLSATDASRISRHSVGLYSFSCIEKIAADVTQNGEISATDASRVARYSINLIGCLNDDDNCTDWVFTPEAVASCAAWPPIVYNSQRDYSPLTGDLIDQDFIAIRLGDVTGNWTPDPAIMSLQALKTASARVLTANCEKNIQQNDTLNIPIVLDQQTAIEGIDITVTFDESILDASDVVLTGGVLDGQNYSLQKNLSIDGEVAIAISANSTLFDGFGTVAVLEFTVVGDTGNTNLIFTRFNVNETVMTGKFELDQNLCENLHFSIGAAPTTGTITGNVTTTFFGQNVYVPGAMVSVVGSHISAVTDADGNYTLTDVPAGSHDLAILMDHFEPLSVSGVSVTAGTTTPISMDDTILTLSYGYSQTELDAAVQTERDKWDANGDGQIGLQEAIRALQVVTGIE